MKKIMSQKLIRFFSLVLLSTTVLGAIPHVARAAVIYIDINNNPEERGTYLHSLAKVGAHEKFLSIPKIDEAASKTLSTMARRRDGIWVRYVNNGCKQDLACVPTPPGLCTDIQKSLWALEGEIAKIPKTGLNADSLRAGLAALKLDPSEPVTLAISGHFGGGVFTGNMGSMSVGEMAKVFNEFPAIRNRITKLHLLGCYTNVFSQVTSLWRAAFPNTRVLAGFYERSPAGSDPRNLNFIRYLVQQSAVFDKIKNEKQFHQMMQSFSTFTGIHSALCVDNMFRETGGEMMFVDETFIPINKCSARLPPSERDYFEQLYFGGLPVPKDTDSSRVRSYYSALRDNALCLDQPAFTSTQAPIPTPDLAMRVLFYQNVIINFRNLYRNQVSSFDQHLTRMGVAKELLLENVNLENRQSLFTWKKNLKATLTQMPDREQAEPLKILFDGYSSVLVDLKPECVPVNWVEPSAFQRSPCLSDTLTGVTCQ